MMRLGGAVSRKKIIDPHKTFVNYASDRCRRTGGTDQRIIFIRDVAYAFR